MHLGNWVGALESWIALQGRFETFFMVADLHALTTDYEHTAAIQPNTVDMVLDWLAAGLDPERSVIFVQSRSPAHAELHLLFSMLVTVPRLERNPTVKEQIRSLHLEEQVSYGLLGYPVLQAADILLYKGDHVPVGEDQVPHVEVTREIARRFNGLYRPVFPEPAPLLTSVPRLPGLDGGGKMSKSAGNTLLLTEEPDAIRAELRKAVTDPEKIRRGDPGHPEVCPVFTYHTAFHADAVPEIESGCRSGALGCVDCKTKLAGRLIDVFAPIRERRADLGARAGVAEDVLRDGTARARVVAGETMKDVWEAMHFTPPKPAAE